ncbi:MAG: hypothetical protein GY757_26925, partial [bacterium]|nr:hypothetical protein [bacterium]
PVLKTSGEGEFAIGVHIVKSLNDLDSVTTTRNRQLTLVVPRGGNACTLLYKPSLIDEDSVILFFLQFLDYIHEVFSNPGASLTGILREGIGLKGRTEHYAKIDGTVIELGELETCLLGHEDIEEAAVVVNQSKVKPELLAFVVSKKMISENSLKEHMLKALHHTSPLEHFVQLDEMPLTAQGVLPRNLLETVKLYDHDENLAETFHKTMALEKEKETTTGSFFEMGVQSLKDAVMIARKHDENGSNGKFCTFMVKDTEKAFKDHLLYSLHQYSLDERPADSTGTANRELLQSVEIKIGTGFETPRDETEEKLAGIFQDVLGMEKSKISITESFFKLGGHSLKAAILITRIHKELDIKIPMSKVFDLPSIKQLSEYIKEAAVDKYVAINPTQKKEYYPQTSPQKRLYFMDQLEKNSTLYNMPLMDIYHLGTEKDKLEEAFKELIKRHEIMRTSFHTIDGEAVQKVHKFEEITFELEYYETREDGMIQSDQSGMEWTQVTGMPFQDVVEHFVKPFDISKPQLIRAGLINIAGAIQIVMVDMHHTVSDGVSLAILKDELWAFYEDKELPPLRIQYKDYTDWAKSAEPQKELKKQEAYWLKEFEGELPVLNLPADYPRPQKMNFEGDLVKFEISEVESRKLNKIARDKGYTLYMVLISMYNVLLAKLSGQEELIVGTVTAGRGHADLLPLIGMFVDTLALRNYPTGEKTLEEFLEDVKNKTVTAFENQDYPFEELVRKVGTRQEAGRNPLFDAVFLLENEDDRWEFLLEVLMLDKSNPYSFNVKQAKFDLMLTCVETQRGIECSIEYKTRLFKQESIEKFARYFKLVITSFCSDLRQKISNIDILPEEEKFTILYEFNDTKVDYPAEKTIHELFEEQAAKTPKNTAVVFDE